jgi:hypothetical protein
MNLRSGAGRTRSYLGLLAMPGASSFAAPGRCGSRRSSPPVRGPAAGPTGPTLLRYPRPNLSPDARVGCRGGVNGGSGASPPVRCASAGPGCGLTVRHDSTQHRRVGWLHRWLRPRPDVTLTTSVQPGTVTMTARRCAAGGVRNADPWRRCVRRYRKYDYIAYRTEPIFSSTPLRLAKGLPNKACAQGTGSAQARVPAQYT